MKKILVFSILVVMGVFSLTYAAYDPTFIGPQQEDPFTQTERCGPQSNGDYVLCEGVGGLINQRQTDFASFLRELYYLAFILAGTVAFVRIVYGGLLYSWSGIIDRKKEALGIFKNVAIGMALLMGSYVVLHTINPALTILNLPDIQKGTGALKRPSGQLGEGATPLSTLEKAEQAIRQENIDRINSFDLYAPAPDDTATIEMINHQIRMIGAPTNAAERARLTELQNALMQYENDKAAINNERDAVTKTPPAQYKRTKTTQ